MPTLSAPERTRLSHIQSVLQPARARGVRGVHAADAGRLIAQLRLDTVTPDGDRAVARFADIVIHDGTSFAVKAALADTYPGRFTTIEPAAVEVHATYSGLADDISHVAMAPDAHAERPFLPAPATLQGRLLLADRGYPDVQHFAAVTAAGGAFIVRLTRSDDPEVRAAWVDGRAIRVPSGRRLAWLLARHAGHVVDADVEFRRDPARSACGWSRCQAGTAG